MSDPTHPHGNPWDPHAYHAPPPSPNESGLLRNRMLFVATAVLAVGAVLHVLKWAFSAIFGTAGAILLVLVLAAAGGYYWYRTRPAAEAQALRDQLTQTARAAASNVTTRAQTVWNTGSLAAERRSSPATHARQPAPPPPAPATPFLPGAPTGQRPAPAGGAAISALLLVPSLVVYAILWNASFNSPWQSWWLVVGLNVWFVLCVTASARNDGRKVLALLLALAGTVLAGVASSPSEEWSLTALLTTERTVEGYTYSEPPYELLPWIHRLPVLIAVLFVIAWSIARRSQPGWVLGLIPAALLAWWSIWYREEGMTTAPNWLTFWLLNVGVFVGGCLACLAADAVTRTGPRPLPTMPPVPPRSH